MTCRLCGISIEIIDIEADTRREFNRGEVYFGSHPDSDFRIDEKHEGRGDGQDKARFLAKLSIGDQHVILNNILRLEEIKINGMPIETCELEKGCLILSIFDRLFVLLLKRASYRGLIAGGLFYALPVIFCLFLWLDGGDRGEAIMRSCDSQPMTSSKNNAIDRLQKMPEEEQNRALSDETCAALVPEDERFFYAYLEAGKFIYAERLLKKFPLRTCGRYAFDYCRRFVEDGFRIGRYGEVNLMMKRCLSADDGVPTEFQIRLIKEFQGHLGQMKASARDDSHKRALVCAGLAFCQ